MLEREADGGAVIAALICLQSPTGPMKKEAAAGGIYDSPWGTGHARVQLLTIEGLLAGHERLAIPQTGDLRTFKKAPRAKKDQGQAQMFD